METDVKKTVKKPKKPLGEVHIIKERCKGCGICVEFCPNNVLQMSEEFTEKGYHVPEVEAPECCIACGLCEMYCPDFAIYIEKLKKKKTGGSDES